LASSSRYGWPGAVCQHRCDLRCLQSRSCLITPPLALLWNPRRVVDCVSVLLGWNEGDGLLASCQTSRRYRRPRSSVFVPTLV
jgi:hypothetical protein